MSSRISPGDSFSSDSDDEEEWSQLQKKSKKKKVPSQPKRSKTDSKLVHLEEGEISSDELDDDEDDGLDDNLIGGEDDKRKLEKMSEKEREEELFKRAERRDAIQARRAVKQKLKEKRDRERAEKANNASKSATAGINSEMSKPKKSSAYANVFSSDSEEAMNSDSSSGAGPRGLRDRKLALEKRKATHSHKFQELIERRRQLAAKKRRLLSGSEGEQDSSANQANTSRLSGGSSFSDSDLDEQSKKTESKAKNGQSMSQQVFSSDESESSDSAARPQARRASLSSSSASQRSESSSEDDARGRSRSPEEELVSSVSDLSRIRLSRFKMEKWVHMPFFDDLVKGCFVRINIGLNQGVPVYRCAEVVDVLETQKIYDLGDTRTNKGVVLRIGKDQSTFRLAFVSNSDFLQAEFDSWMRRITDANMKPPTMAFVRRKAADIQEAIVRPIRDERVVEQIIQSKRRFQKAPTNFAMRKAELMKERELAEANGDTEALRRVDLELEEIELQAERIERRRTLGFKSITSINQRNRVLSVQQAEEAIRKESEEAQKSKEDDPYTRIHSQPVIVTKKYLEQLRIKRKGKSDPQSDSTTNSPTASAAALNATEAPANSLKSVKDSLLPNTPDSLPCSIGDEDSNMSTPQESLHAIHDFEININLDLDGAGDQPRLTQTSQPGRLDPTDTGTRLNGTDNPSSTPTPNGPLGKSNRRLLNLQEYKKRHGLI
ncbi:unnamed protein product [Calicophoron daubneyi]|uniref:Plus3 domain-containing protein n=1 Tax=Calicophoron daubneyi TaxID=300641 RepID=A0AAV2TR33_CALDB